MVRRMGYSLSLTRSVSRIVSLARRAGTVGMIESLGRWVLQGHRRQEVRSMALTTEIPRERWKEDLAAFSERNAGRPVRVEVEVTAGEGEPLLAEHQPLLGIDFDPKGSEAPAIEVA